MVSVICQNVIFVLVSFCLHQTVPASNNLGSWNHKLIQDVFHKNNGWLAGPLLYHKKKKLGTITRMRHPYKKTGNSPEQKVDSSGDDFDSSEFTDDEVQEGKMDIADFNMPIDTGKVDKSSSTALATQKDNHLQQLTESKKSTTFKSKLNMDHSRMDKLINIYHMYVFPNGKSTS